MEKSPDMVNRFGSLEVEIQKLLAVWKENSVSLERIAEVQAHHGEVQERHGAALERIEKAVEPLKPVSAALQSILPDHERRITALERASSTRTPKP